MKHFFDEVDGWFNFSKPYRAAVKAAEDGAIFVELGCWKGKSASFLGVEIINSGKSIALHCIDHWGGSNEPAHKADPDLERVFDIFNENMDRIDGLDLHVHRMASAPAAHLFEDGTIDFVWIDAGHEYEEVMADIEAWWPKVKAGGVMGGDDYPMDGVKKAVDTVFPGREVGSENGWQWWRVRKKG